MKKENSTFKYTDPRELGYERVKVSRKTFNEAFPDNKQKFFMTAEVYYSKDLRRIRIQYIVNIIGAFLNTLMYPIALLYEGFGDFNEINRQTYEYWNQKKTGAFTIDSIYSAKGYFNTSEYYNECIKNLGIVEENDRNIFKEETEKELEFEYGEVEWAVFKNGEIWTDSIGDENYCIEHIQDCVKKGKGAESEFTYKLITEEERQEG